MNFWGNNTGTEPTPMDGISTSGLWDNIFTNYEPPPAEEASGGFWDNLFGQGNQGTSSPRLSQIFPSSWNKKSAGRGIQAINENQTIPGSGQFGAYTTLDAEGGDFQWQDMNKDNVFNPGEEYDPSNSIWNDWLNAQNAQYG